VFNRRCGVRRSGVGAPRSTDPDGVAQELYAYLITYQALRCLMHQAAIAADIDPDRLSFTTALRAVRRAITATGRILGHAVQRAITEILEDQHERRERVSPRVVKRSQSPYPSKKHADQPTSITADYTVEIVHTEQS
jgi:hypothetical protein